MERTEVNAAEEKIAAGRADKAINLSYVRAYNVRLIMKILYEKPLSCLELSEKIGISDVGIRKIVKNLQANGMLRVAREENVFRKKGNQHIRYTIDPAYGFFLIIDFTHLSEAYEVFDYAGNLLFSRRIFSVPYEDVSDEDLLWVIGEIKRALTDWGIDCGKLLNIQICVPGQVDEKMRCFIVSHRFRRYENDGEGRFFRLFEDAFGVSVAAKNNVAYMALGELEKGSIGGYGSAVYFFVGYGIATSVLYNGKLVEGWRGYAGEIGGSKFGNDGTFSMNCSINRLKDKCAPYLETPDFAGLLKAYRAGGPVREIVLKSADVLGAFISMFSNFIGAEVAMIGGESLEYGEEYFGRVKNYVYSHTIPKTRVIVSALKNAAVLGALEEAKKRTIADYNERRSAEM